MWVRGAAIRPVPAHAVLGIDVLERVERRLASGEDVAKNELDRAFARFETTQPDLAGFVSDVLAKPLDETALALGYFLSIAVWLSFEAAFPGRLGTVNADSLSATADALALEEELRAENTTEPFDVDDVLSVEQPHVIAFVHQHIDAALEVDAAEPRDVDVDDVHSVYRSIVVLTLALSQAVTPLSGVRPTELLA